MRLPVGLIPTERAREVARKFFAFYDRCLPGSCSIVFGIHSQGALETVPGSIERAEQLRTGGYVIDFWGLGYDVAEKMGLLPTLKEVALPVDGLKFVDERGNRKGGFGPRAIRSMLGRRYMSLLRSDLAKQIYGALGGEVRTIFGDTITRLQQDDAGVLVEFRSGHSERFDLVFGAGGLHSPVRKDRKSVV